MADVIAWPIYARLLTLWNAFQIVVPILNKKDIPWNVYLPNVVFIPYHNCAKQQVAHIRHYSTDDIMESQRFRCRTFQGHPRTKVKGHGAKRCPVADILFKFNWTIIVSFTILANVNSRSRLLYVIARPSVVCLSSVTLVRSTQAVQIFGNISTAFGTLAIRWHPHKILRRSSQRTPPPGELNTRGVAKYSDFGPIDGYISETAQDRR